MPLGDFIANGVGAQSASGSQAIVTPRVAVMFTSRLRQLAVRGSAATSANATLIAAAQQTGASAAQTDPAAAQALAFFGNDSSFMATIAMALNPNSWKFVQSKRFSKKDTREGSVFFHFTNSQGQNNDILTIQGAGNTGNIDLRGSLGDPNQSASASQEATTNASAGDQDTGALYKLLAWHNLYLMTREPMLLADNTENTFTIVYSSALFPTEITFNGFFSRVLEFEENAQKPNSRNYSFEFTVTSTFPDLDTVLQQLTSILGAPPTTAAFTNPANGSIAVAPDIAVGQLA